MTAADLASLKPGDVVDVRATVMPCEPAGNAGDHLKVRVGRLDHGAIFYAPIEQVARAAGDAPPRAFLAALSDGAARDLHNADILAALCGAHGRVTA